MTLSLWHTGTAWKPLEAPSGSWLQGGAWFGLVTSHQMDFEAMAQNSSKFNSIKIRVPKIGKNMCIMEHQPTIGWSILSPFSCVLERSFCFWNPQPRNGGTFSNGDSCWTTIDHQRLPHRDLIRQQLWERLGDEGEENTFAHQTWKGKSMKI